MQEQLKLTEAELLEKAAEALASIFVAQVDARQIKSTEDVAEKHGNRPEESKVSSQDLRERKTKSNRND